jgi:ABC-type phosphate transport system permease subunit
MNVSNMEILDDSKAILYRVKFLILIILQIPSVVLYLFIFAYFVTHLFLLKAPQNQALLILLCVNFLEASGDLPMVDLL